MLPVAQSILRNLLDLVPLLDESPTATPAVTETPAAAAATPVATGTPVVTATPAVVATPVPATPVPTATPLPSAWNPAQWLRTSGWSGEFHGVFLAIFILVALAAVVVYFYLSQRRFKAHSLNARLAERVSIILTGFAVVGLLLLFFAVAKTPLLSAPIWLIISLVSLIAAGVYGIYYYVSFYPVELEKYQREQERIRYIPKGKSKGPAYTPPMKKKQGKQSKQDKQDKKKQKK